MSGLITVNEQTTVNVGSLSFTEQIAILGNLAIQGKYSLPVAQPGVTATAGGITSGTLTMTNSSHGIVNAQRIDVYFPSGGWIIGVTVTGVSGVTVTVGATGTFGGGASAYPTTGQAVIVATPQQINLTLTGSNAQLIVLQNLDTVAANSALFGFYAGSTEDFMIELLGGRLYEWDATNGVTNPISGDSITALYVSHNNTANAVVLQVGIATN